MSTPVPFKVVTIVTDLVGFVGNSFLLYSLMRKPPASRLTGVLTKWQFGADALVCGVELIVTAVNWYLLSTYDTFDRAFATNSPFWAGVSCYVWRSQLQYFVFLYFSAYNLLCLAMDRYWLICKATIYKQNHGRCIILCFIFNSIASLEVIATVAPHYSIHNGTFCVNSPVYPVISTVAPKLWFTFNYFLPSIALFVIYGKVLLHSLEHSKKMDGLQVPASTATTAATSRKKNQVGISTVEHASNCRLSTTEMTNNATSTTANANNTASDKKTTKQRAPSKPTPEMIKLTMTMMGLAVQFVVCFAMGRFGFLLASFGWIDFQFNSPQQLISAFLYTVCSATTPFLYVGLLSGYRGRCKCDHH